MIPENSNARIAKLVQNRVVNFFQKCLTLGQYLSQEEKEALYRYLLGAKKNEYASQAAKLIQENELKTFIANGEIQYKINSKVVSYTARKLDEKEFTPAIRKLKLGILGTNNIRKLSRFFAQAEVDVLSNFPLPGTKQESDSSFGINTFPYYTFNYYSNGKGRLRGLLKKLKSADPEALIKLRTL